MKYTVKRPNEECENCHKVGGVIVWIHVIKTYGKTQKQEGMRDCTICRGLPQ